MTCEERSSGGTARPGPFHAIRILLFAVLAALALVLQAEAQSPIPEPADRNDGVPAAEPSDSGNALEVSGRSAPRGVGAGGNPGLDDLLRLPSDFKTRSTGRPVAGASEDEWRQRFVRAEKAIGAARDALVDTKRQLDQLAETGGGSQWSVAPPGGSGAGQESTSPLSFKLRQQLQREREALDEAERALRELKIEADLAGVPAEWRIVPSSPTAQN